MEEVREMFQIVKFVILIFSFIAIFIYWSMVRKESPCGTHPLR